MMTSNDAVRALADCEGAWEAWAMALLTPGGAEKLGGERLPPLPGALGVLSAAAPSQWGFTLKSDGPYHDGRWVVTAPFNPVNERTARVMSAAGVAATELRWFASNERDPMSLVAAWTPDAPDAQLYEVWLHPHDAPEVTGVGTVRSWLRDVIEALVMPQRGAGSLRVTVGRAFEQELRELLRRAGELRLELQQRRQVRAAELARAASVAGAGAELLQQWEQAEAELDRVATVPLAWRRLVDGGAAAVLH